MAQDALVQAREAAILTGELTSKEASVFVDFPKDAAHGDLASNLALAMARAEGKPPRTVAETLKKHMPERDWLEKVEIAGPGFLNFWIRTPWLADALPVILREGDDFGRSHVGDGRRVLVEFVSANPTGPLNVVSARAAAVGDALSSVLAYAGFEVLREFYVNDAGSQVELLARSVQARLRELDGKALEIPEGGYQGGYVKDVAKAYREQHGGKGEDDLTALRDFALTAITAGQRQDFMRYRTRFDSFYSERSLHERGKIEEALTRLRETASDLVYEEGGALWLRTTRFGDDKDRVIRKSDGSFTYFAPDISYHMDKYDRGYDTVIDLLGPDHHGYIGRMRAAIAALGRDPETFEVLLIQWVRLLRDGKAVGMSKRAGEFVTLADLMDEVGTDAARFLFLMRSHDSPLDFDLTAAREETSENPVFSVQYAHARIASILRQAQGAVPGEPDLSLLAAPEERDLMRKLCAFTDEIEIAALAREPHRLTRYCMDLSGLFHSFYNKHRVLGVEPELTAARLMLIRAVQQVLKNALTLLGVNAPERM